MISKEEFDQIQPGDRVQIVDKWVGGGHNSEGLMDKWLGQIMTVMKRDQRDLMMEEDRHDRDAFAGLTGGWFWKRNMIERVIYDKVEISLDSVF